MDPGDRVGRKGKYAGHTADAVGSPYAQGDLLSFAAGGILQRARGGGIVLADGVGGIHGLIGDAVIRVDAGKVLLCAVDERHQLKRTWSGIAQPRAKAALHFRLDARDDKTSQACEVVGR